MTADAHPTACPDATLLAGLADGTLSAPDREAVTAHVSGCERCLEQVGALVRLARDEAPLLPDSLRRRVERAAPRRWQPAVAMAAAVCLSVGGWFYLQRPEIAPGQSASDLRDAVRSADAAGETPVVRHPSPDQRVPAGSLAVEWQPVAQAVAYRVRVLKDDGQLLWEGESRDPGLVVPAAAGLPVGVPLYVTVTALLPDARTTRAPSTRFMLTSK